MNPIILSRCYRVVSALGMPACIVLQSTAVTPAISTMNMEPRQTVRGCTKYLKCEGVLSKLPSLIPVSLSLASAFLADDACEDGP